MDHQKLVQEMLEKQEVKFHKEEVLKHILDVFDYVHAMKSCLNYGEFVSEIEAWFSFNETEAKMFDCYHL